MLADAGVSLTFDRCNNINALFQECYYITEIGELDFSTVTRRNCTAIFSTAPKLKTIDKIILPVGQTTFSNWFYNCNSLENVIFEGTIEGDNFNVQWCPLTHESLMSIINTLKDYSGTDTWKSITLGPDNIAKLTADELLIMEQKQWDYI